jgi:hypothetical protein
MKRPLSLADAPLLPPESVIGKPEPFLGHERVIGLGMPLRCPHCGGELEFVGGHPEKMHQSCLQCDNGHLLTVSVIDVPGQVVFYLATAPEAETNVN